MVTPSLTILNAGTTVFMVAASAIRTIRRAGSNTVPTDYSGFTLFIPLKGCPVPPLTSTHNLIHPILVKLRTHPPSTNKARPIRNSSSSVQTSLHPDGFLYSHIEPWAGSSAN